MPSFIARSSLMSALLVSTLGVISIRASVQPAVADAPADAATPVVGPLTYYQTSCARCHGNYGTGYTDALKKVPETELGHAVEDMAAGPAQAPLEGQPLRDQIALHEAWRHDAPYAWLAPRADNTPLTGEALPNSEITITLDGTPTPVKLDGHTFTLDTAGKKIGDVTVKLNGKETKVAPATRPSQSTLLSDLLSDRACPVLTCKKADRS